MTIKISGDSSEDLAEIHYALSVGILGQERFETLEERYSGWFGITETYTEAWIGNDGEYVRMVLSSAPQVIDDLFNSDQLLDY